MFANRLFFDLRILSSYAKIASVPFWYIINAPNIVLNLTGTSIIRIDPYCIAIQVLNLIGVPILLVRLIVPRVLEFVIKHNVLADLQLN